MGAGKSTIGKLLATELSLPFIDSDNVIVERAGADISWIFDVEGEEGFRSRETAVLADICGGSPAVVATGGGIVMRHENRDLISGVEAGVKVYLEVDLEQQIQRTAADKKRPLLSAGDPEEVLTQLFEIREPLYKSLADISYPSTNRNPKQVASNIAVKVHEFLSAS